MTSPEALALAAALCFGCASFLTRKGLLGQGTVLQALVVTLGINCAILWTLGLFFVPLEHVTSPALLWFVLSGIFAPGLGRVFNYRGLDLLGASRNTPVISTAPLFAAVIAWAFLGERLTPELLGGTVLIVGGVAVLSLQPSGTTIDRRHFLLPVLAALFYGLSFPISKVGLRAVPDEILGSTVTTTTSFLLLVVYLFARGGEEDRAPALGRRAWLWFSLSGASTSAAFLLTLSALRGGAVTLATPLISTYPLFTVALSRVFLQASERVRRNVWAGAVLVVAGVTWIATP